MRWLLIEDVEGVIELFDGRNMFSEHIGPCPCSSRINLSMNLVLFVARRHPI